MLPLLLLAGALASSAPQHETSTRRWLAEDFELSIWDVERGLPQRSARSIAQTPDGVIWIGTFDGLARLTSRGVVALRGPVPGTHTDNAFVTLLADRSGRLWAGTANDILCLEQGTWRAYGRNEGCADGVVYDLAEDAEGRILASTARGLTRLVGGRFERLALPAEFEANPEHPRLEADHAGRIWVQGRRALACLEDERWTVVTSRTGSDGNLGLAPASGGGVWVLEDRTLTRRDARGAHQRFELPAGLEPGDASLCEDPNGNLWLGTFASGLARRSHDGHWSIAREEHGLPHSMVPCLFLDQAGSLWAGTSGAGAVRIADPRFRRLHDTSPLVDDNVVTALCRGADGGRYYATHSGGLYRIDGLRAHELRAPTGKEAVSALAADPAGGLWVGTEASGLWHLQQGEVQSLRAVPASFGPILALESDGAGRLWLAGNEKLGVLEPEGLRLQDFPDTRIFDFALDGAGRIWAATSRGAYRSTAALELEHRPEVAGERALRSVLAEGATRLWFTADGPELIRLDGTARRSFGADEGFRLEQGRLLFADAIGP